MNLPAPMTSYDDLTLATSITRAASRQTYYIIRFLVDKNLVQDAYRSYAYFRWVDDWIDTEGHPRSERLAFLQRQQWLIASVEDGAAPPNDLAPEERLAVDLLQREPDRQSGLHAYFHNLMSVMAFDAGRRGRLITQHELDQYTQWLAVGVTEAMHYFIGHDCAAPKDETRYLAVKGAHITHMLRDTLEDVAAGYFNVPKEVLAASKLSPSDVAHPAYRSWVQQRVREARDCFRVSRAYLDKVENLRCRIAAYAYTHYFEAVLDCIELEGCRLRRQYPRRKNQNLGMITWALWMGLMAHKASPSGEL